MQSVQDLWGKPVTMSGAQSADAEAATLTVTSANEKAVALYERVGFRTIRLFSAYAWEGF